MTTVMVDEGREGAQTLTLADNLVVDEVNTMRKHTRLEP